jgi:hypothetical protein
MQEKNDIVGAKLDAALKIYANKNASVDELERTVSSLSPVIVVAQGDIEALTAHRRKTLLSGSEADRVKLKDNIAAAETQLEQLVTVAEELDARLVQAREDANNANRARRRDELLGNRDLLAKRWWTEYPKAATAIRDLILDSARLDIEIENFNKVAPAEEALQTSENIVRRRDPEPRKKIRCKTVELWCRYDETSPLPAEFQGSVQDQGGGHGALPNRVAQSTPCVSRKFELIEFYAAERIPYFEPLAQSVNLPGLLAGDFDIWRAVKHQSHPQAWLDEGKRSDAAASARSAATTNSPVETELWLIDDAAQRRVKVA